MAEEAPIDEDTAPTDAPEPSHLGQPLTRCGDIVEDFGTHTVTFAEEYDFEELTARLRANPKLADFSGISLVEDCESAREVMKAQQELSGPQERHGEGAGEIAPQDKIRGGTRVSGHRGLVTIEVFNSTTSTWDHSCTGAMVSRNLILTAAHCLQPGVAAGSLGAQRFTIRYFDPAVGSKELVTGWNEVLDVWQRQNYAGTDDWDNDIGVIRRRAGAWTNTDAGDYLRIYAGAGDDIGTTRLWGAGYASSEGWGSGILRYGDFPLLRVGTDRHITQATSQLGACAGDSGGPRVKTAGGDEMIVSLHVFSNRTNGVLCSVPGAEQVSARVTTSDLTWLTGATGIGCSWGETSTGVAYRQCW